MNKPLLLKPSGKDYLWGGKRLNDEFSKNIEMCPLAETWECSTRLEGPSFVVGGEYDGMTLREVLALHPEYLGKYGNSEGELPILIKFIDANKDLSVQVHPDDEFAKKNENGQLGKTEMWYVLDATRGAKLIYGLQCESDSERIRKSIIEGDIEKLVRKVTVNRNDVFFIKPGTIHAIGAGILLAEIQENSNLTYRLYDYNRIDKDGKQRELHIDKALAVANLNGSEEPRQPIRVLRYKPGIAKELLCHCNLFEVHRLIVNTERRNEVLYRADKFCFKVLLCIGGCGILIYGNEYKKIYKGDCIFIPADAEAMEFHGQIQFIEVVC